MTQQFIEAAAEAEPSVLISEGTRMVRQETRRNLSEAQVLEGVMEVCSQADRENRIVLYTHGPRDMDRLRTFYTAAVRCGRNLVINTKTAHLLHRLVDDEHLDLPDPIGDDCVKVYFRKKRSGEYREKDYYIWERQFLDKMVTDSDLNQRPGEHVVNMGFTTFTELIDIRPEPGSHFIYSMSEHFSEDSIEDAVMHNWLRHFDLRYHQLHASGHMSRNELLEMLQTIKPKSLIPVHTEGAALFSEVFEGTILPALDKKYTISK